MPLGEDHKTLLEKYGPYVRSLASQVRKQFSGTIELEELMAYGQVGLLEAAQRFDPKVGANFLTFAHYRIKGAIFDGLRKMGVLKGAESRAAERANSYMGSKHDQDMGSNPGSSTHDDVNTLSNAVTGLAMVFATSLEGTEGLQVADEQLGADEKLELEEMRRRVRAAIEKLPEKERKLLEGYYFQQKTLEEAGAAIGQSKSWASRLHARAVEQLRDLLEKDDTPSLSKHSKSPASGPARRDSHGGTVGRNLGGADRPAETPGPGRGPGR